MTSYVWDQFSLETTSEYGIFVPERVETFSGVAVQVESPGKYGALDSPAEKKNFIVFRDDDIAPFWSFGTVFNITETFRNRKVAHVMGLIPDPYGNNIDADPVLRDYLMNVKNDPSIEFALHGNDHSDDEFGSLSFSEASFRVAEGLNIVENSFGIRPVTFVPPYHVYNNNTISALRLNNVSIISSGTDDVYRGVAFREVDGVWHFPATTDFYNWDKNRDNTLDEIKASCENAMSVYGGCVILLHHHMFADSSGRFVSSKMKIFSDVLDWAKAKELDGTAEIILFRDMLPGQPEPLPVLTIISPLELTYNTPIINLNVSVSEILLNLSYTIDGGNEILLCSGCNASNSVLNLSLLNDGNHTLSVDGVDNAFRIVTESVAFSLDRCVPEWTCGGYGGCLADDIQYCNVSLDLNGCYGKTNQSSDLFDGDVSVLGVNSC
ncbi:MAG: DUF2334 domain-containing protein, partial [archaeon]